MKYNIIMSIGWLFGTKKEDIKKKSYEIVDSMVSLLNFVMIEMVRIPFAPQTMMLTPLLLYCTVKFEKRFIMKWYSKPRRPWKAQKAGFVFSLFYFMSLIMVGLPVVVYFYYSETFPKNCDIQVR